MKGTTKFAACLGLVAVLCLIPLCIHSPFYIHVVSLAFLYTIATVSMRAIMISGQFPLAHAAFMGIGAYASAAAAKWLGFPVPLSILLGALTATAIGILTGWPFARLRAIYYAMVSLFFGIGVMKIICAGGTWTGSYSGLTGVPTLFGGSPIGFYYFFLVLASLSLLALHRFEFSRLGVSLKAIAQSHLVASSVGINEARYRTLALAVGCFFVGFAGALYGHFSSVVSPSSFDLSATLWLVIYVTVGGSKRFMGPIVGTALLVMIPEIFRDLKMYTPYVSAGILLVVAFFMPEGVIGLFRSIRLLFVRNPGGE